MATGIAAAMPPGREGASHIPKRPGDHEEEIMARKSSQGTRKIHKVMKEQKQGKLKSGSGKKVKSRKQAVAIALNEARKSGAKIPKRKS